MAEIARVTRWLVETSLWPFDRLPGAIGLTAFAVVTGLLILAVVARTTPRRRLTLARDRMSAAIYEIRLYLDSPRRIFSAQRRLLAWSGLYLLYLSPAFLVMLPFLALFYAPLEIRHGLAAVPPGDGTLVRIQLSRAPRGSGEVRVEGGWAVRLSAPPVLVADEGVLYLRLSIAAAGVHPLRITGDGWQVDKRVVAEAKANPISAERRAGVGALWAMGNEPPLPAGGPVTAVTVVHPPSSRRFAGLSIPWWLYWLLVATAVAFALRKRFGVAL